MWTSQGERRKGKTTKSSDAEKWLCSVFSWVFLGHNSGGLIKGAYHSSPHWHFPSCCISHHVFFFSALNIVCVCHSHTRVSLSTPSLVPSLSPWLRHNNMRAEAYSLFLVTTLQWEHKALGVWACVCVHACAQECVCSCRILLSLRDASDYLHYRFIAQFHRSPPLLKLYFAFYYESVSVNQSVLLLFRLPGSPRVDLPCQLLWIINLDKTDYYYVWVLASPEVDRTAEHLWDTLSHSVAAAAAAALKQRIKFMLFESHCLFPFLFFFE